MGDRPFSLLPFPGGPALPFRIGGSVSRQGSLLSLVYELTGALAEVAWPPAAAVPTRRDRLWETTCAECFFARPEEAGYWEANFSPAGHWQLYRFDDYREGMHPEAAVTTMALCVETAEKHILSATLDLGPLLAPDQPLLVGITMVVRTVAGATSYWGLAHPGEKPDFHHRAGFLLTL